MKATLYRIKAHIKGHKKRYWLDGICYTLFIMTVLLAGIFSESYDKSLNEHLDDIYGKYDLVMLGESDISDGMFYTFGTVDDDEHYNTLIGYFDENGYSQAPVKVIEGRLPKSENEIAAESSFLYSYDSKLSIGDTVELNLYDIYDEEKKISYILVGIIDNYTFRTNFDIDTNVEHSIDLCFPSIIVGNASESFDSISHSLLEFDESEDAPKDIISKKDIISNQYKEAHGNDVTIKLLFLMILIIGIISLLGITFFHKWEDTKFIADMKCAGSTIEYIIVFRILTVAAVSMPSIIIGSILGFAFSFVLINIDPIKSLGYIEFIVDPVTCVFAIAISFSVIIFITLIFTALISQKRPLALRSKKMSLPTQTIRISNNLFSSHPLIVWGIKSIIYNSAQYASIILTVTLICFSYFIVRYIADDVVDNYSKNINGDYRLDFSNYNVESSLYIIEDDDFYRMKDIESISSLNEVRSAQGYTSMKMQMIADNNYTPSLPFSEIEDPDINDTKLSYGYNENEILYNCEFTYGTEGYIKELITKYNIDSMFVPTENVIYITNTTSDLNVGDTIYFTHPMRQDDHILRCDFELTVSVVVTVNDDYLPWGEFYASDKIFDESVDIKYRTIEIVLNDREIYTETEDALQQLKIRYIKQNDSFRLTSKREYNEARMNELSTIYIIATTIMLALVAYYVVTLYNVISGKLRSNRRTWAILRTLGLTRKYAFTQCATETVIINVIGFACATALYSILYFVENNIMPQKEFSAENLSLLFLVFMSSLAVCLITTFVVIRKFWKGQIIDQICDE